MRNTNYQIDKCSVDNKLLALMKIANHENLSPQEIKFIDDNVTLDDMNKYNELKFDFKKTELVSNNFTESINFIEIFIFGLIAGFLALLTPCIFPMIPLTVSYFLDETKLKFSSLKSASLYGFFIVLIRLVLPDLGLFDFDIGFND